MSRAVSMWRASGALLRRLPRSPPRLLWPPRVPISKERGSVAAAVLAAACAAPWPCAWAEEQPPEPTLCVGEDSAPPRTPLPQRPVHHVLRPHLDPRVDHAVLIRYDPPEDRRTGACVVICPGGNYEYVSGKEGQPVAAWLAELGVTAFVLRYNCITEGHYWPAQLADLELAIRTVRSHAVAWRVDGRRVGVMGFSAGGHLASMAATTEDLAWRPNAQILVYPSIDVTKPDWWPWKAAEGFPPPEAASHRLVRPGQPPAYLAVSTEDGLCTAEDNTEPYERRLSMAGVEFEHVVKPMGKHGHGLHAGWTEPCEAWLARLGWIGPISRPAAK